MMGVCLPRPVCVNHLLRVGAVWVTGGVERVSE